MMSPEYIFEILKLNFSNSVLEFKSDLPIEPFIIVPALKIDQVCRFLKSNDQLYFDSLVNLSGVDDFNGEKVKDESGNEFMKGGTLSVFYHLESIKHKHKLCIKILTDRDNPIVVSVTDIWKSADWHEREAYDMLGIKFINHPDLKRILMPYDWNAGFPLRKDYANPEFYQGMKVPY